MSPFPSSDSASIPADPAPFPAVRRTSSCPASRSRLRNRSSLLGFSAPCRRRPRNRRPHLAPRGPSRRLRSPALASTCQARAAAPPCRESSGRIAWRPRPYSAQAPPSRRTSRSAPSAAPRQPRPDDTRAPPPASGRDQYSFRLPLRCGPLRVLSPLPLFADFDAHIACRSHDGSHRRLHVGRIQIGQLRLRDLFHLFARQLRHFVPIRLRRALHDPRGALKQFRSGRRLQNKREAAVAVDSHEHRDNHPVRLLRRFPVELLAEIHDVHAVRAECRAHRRRRRCLPCRQLQFDRGFDLLRHFYATFSTCAKSSSTGVERPKIVTETFNVLRSEFTSSTTPVKFANGPSPMRTFSPRSNESFGFGFSAVVVARFRMFCTSSSVSGEGICPDPTNPVTFGVDRTTCQV